MLYILSLHIIQCFLLSAVWSSIDQTNRCGEGQPELFYLFIGQRAGKLERIFLNWPCNSCTYRQYSIKPHSEFFSKARNHPVKNVVTFSRNLFFPSFWTNFWAVGHLEDLKHVEMTSFTKLNSSKRKGFNTYFSWTFMQNNPWLAALKQEWPIWWLWYSRDHSSYYSINGGKVDLINQLPARANPFLCMTEATSMVEISFQCPF